MVYFQKLDGSYNFYNPYAWFRISSNLKKTNHIDLTAVAVNGRFSFRVSEFKNEMMSICLCCFSKDFKPNRTDISQGAALTKRLFYDLVLKLN